LGHSLTALTQRRNWNTLIGEGLEHDGGAFSCLAAIGIHAETQLIALNGME